MRQKTYPICLISIVIIALAVGVYFYNHMEKDTADRQGALLVKEEIYE